MSYWIYLEIDTGGDEDWPVYERNCTSNVVPMWREALGGDGLAAFHHAPASEAAGPLNTGVRRMEADPAKYRAMNPPNGWGNYEDALDVLRELRDACHTHPLTRIRISR